MTWWVLKEKWLFATMDCNNWFAGPKHVEWVCTNPNENWNNFFSQHWSVSWKRKSFLRSVKSHKYLLKTRQPISNILPIHLHTLLYIFMRRHPDTMGLNTNVEAGHLAFLCVLFSFVPIWEISPCHQPWWQLLCSLESTPPSSVDEFSTPPARNNYFTRNCTIQLSLIFADTMGQQHFKMAFSSICCHTLLQEGW